MGVLSTIKNRASFNYFASLFHDSELPLHREVNQYKGIYKVDLFDKRQPFGNMHESIYSGISVCKYEASIIALCEFFERCAVQDSGVGYSNGCAAHPVYLSKKISLKVASRRAFNEAAERFAFYNWFVDHSVAHSWLCMSGSLKKISELVREKKSIGQIKISVKYSGYLVVSYIELKGGLLFGTAMDQNLSIARNRSESELLRNSLSYLNSSNEHLRSRLDEEIFMVAANGKNFIRRIFNPGEAHIKIPLPRETYELEHKSKEKVVVVRSIIGDKKYSKSTLCDYH